MDPDRRIPATAGIRLIVDDPLWRRRVPRLANLVARAGQLAAGDGGISVVLTDDRTVRRLNARHRGQNKPTNVLSFDSPGPGAPGELVLAFGVVCREAAQAGRRVRDHLAHLIVHGVLHLAGYDHVAAGEAREMEMEEARLLARIGVGNPWRARPVSGAER